MIVAIFAVYILLKVNVLTPANHLQSEQESVTVKNVNIGKQSAGMHRDMETDTVYLVLLNMVVILK